MGRIPYVLYPTLHPGPVNPPSGTSTFALSFLPSALTDGEDGLVAHVAVLRMTVNGSISVPAGATIRPDDWALLMAQNPNTGPIEGIGVTLTARGRVPVQCSFLNAWRIQQSIATNSGLTPDLTHVGPSISNTTIAAVNYPVTLTYTLRFCDERWTDPFRYLMPLQWWIQGSWAFVFSDPVAVFGAGFAWQTTPTFALSVDRLMSPHIIMAAPFEWRDVVRASKSNDTVIWQPGVYDVAGYLSPAFGGASGLCCDDLVAKLSLIPRVADFPSRFPADITPLQWGMMQVSDGAVDGPFSVDMTVVNGATNLPSLATIRLFGPPLSGHRVSDVTETQFLLDKQISWVINMVPGQTLTWEHTFYMARALRRPDCGGPSDIGGATGATLLREIPALLKGCSGATFGGWQPYVAPGMMTPPMAMGPRVTLVSLRSGF